MSLSILNNISSLTAENALSNTQASLQKTLTQLSTGLRINSGADDAAGLSIANGLQANIAALTQSQLNASNGIGMLQTADGALSQVTSLLNRAVTLAQEAANSTLDTAGNQATALNEEFQKILDTISSIGDKTEFNGQQVFSDSALSIAMGDGDANGDMTVTPTIGALTTTNLGLNTDDLTTDAATALADITTAISTVAAQRGTVGAAINQLQSASNIMNTQVQNLQSAENSVMNADIGKTVADMTQYNILQSTGMSALQQSNQAQQAVLKLLQ
jgi:flagellin